MSGHDGRVDLAGWLLEQIAEDERAARDETVRLQKYPPPSGVSAYAITLEDTFTPARVLAECEAKRLIVDLFPTKAPVYDSAGNFHGMTGRVCSEHRTVGPHRAWCSDCSEWCYPDIGCLRCDDAIPHSALRLLAVPYADRPGYRDEWRPA